VLFALDSHGLRHLLIPAREDLAIDSDEKSGGVHISARDLLDDGVKSRFVDVACLKDHVADVFSHLADEILEELARNPGRPATVARRVLNRWRELLDRDRPGILTQDELTGLFGELWILKSLVAEDPSALGAWTGPQGSRFDFQRAGVALEVKTTTSQHSLLVQIHGVEQLDPPIGGTLYMATVSVERTVGVGHSVPSLIAEIRVLGVDNLEFSSKLREIRYADYDQRYYADLRFTVRAVRVFKVDAEFPRIIGSSFCAGELPAGVSSLRYTIDLTSPPPAALDDGAATTAFAELLRV
jgi:hypothetical protein